MMRRDKAGNVINVAAIRPGVKTVCHFNKLYFMTHDQAKFNEM